MNIQSTRIKCSWFLSKIYVTLLSEIVPSCFLVSIIWCWLHILFCFLAIHMFEHGNVILSLSRTIAVPKRNHHPKWVIRAMKVWNISIDCLIGRVQREFVIYELILVSCNSFLSSSNILFVKNICNRHSD